MSEPNPIYDVAEWHGCYDDSWNGIITPESFAHPAKFARGLIHRIYAHLLERGYIAPGDTVVDPFGGIAAGAYDALLFGLHWTGCELEPRFVEMGNANIDKYRRDLAMLNGRLGTARLLQGDSRRLVEIVGGGAGATVSSPPFETTVNHDGGRADYLEAKRLFSDYGRTPGQLGSMPSGSYSAAVGSPPYADAINNSGEGPGARHDPVYHNGDNAFKQSSANGYGVEAGNLGNMPGDGFEAAVSSPPFETAVPSRDNREKLDRLQAAIVRDGRGHGGSFGPSVGIDYGSDPANIGNDTGDTFWSAARQIVEQTYAVLKPGGYAAWVTKRFVRNKQIVEFSEQWAQLCEAVGFVRVEWIHALLVEDHGDQLDIFGGAVNRRKERKSFFRRLAEKKGSPRIDHEDVIIMRRPL